LNLLIFFHIDNGAVKTIRGFGVKMELIQGNKSWDLGDTLQHGGVCEENHLILGQLISRVACIRLLCFRTPPVMLLYLIHAIIYEANRRFIVITDLVNNKIESGCCLWCHFCCLPERRIRYQSSCTLAFHFLRPKRRFPLWWSENLFQFIFIGEDALDNREWDCRPHLWRLEKVLILRNCKASKQL